jgi:hypothetical protein
MCFLTCKQFIQLGSVLLMILGVEQNVINVDNNVDKALHGQFHQPLKTGWTSQETHWTDNPFKLSMAW